VREVEDGTLRLGTEVEAFEQDESGARVLFADCGQESADILIGADGLRSRVRDGLFGPKEPRYAGYTAWRAVVEPNEELLPWGAGFESWGRGARFGCAHVDRGRVYWFATANATEGGKDGPPGSPAGAKATLSHLFSGWHRLGESTFYRLHRAGREGLPKELMVRFEGVAGDSSGSGTSDTGTSDSRNWVSAATPSASTRSVGWSTRSATARWSTRMAGRYGSW
jgi:hypothetical protein